MRIFTRECDSCGRLFEAVRATAEVCSATCRVRRSRERKAARAVAAADDLLSRQSRLIAALSASADAAERRRLAATLSELAHEGRALIAA